MVVIKCNLHMDGDDYHRLQRDLQAQASTGVIVLPPWCELLNEVPADEKVKVVQHGTE